MFYVQREIDGQWNSEKETFTTIAEAKEFANNLNVGTDPTPLRIIDENNQVRAWVSRNGYLPRGALPPRFYGAFPPPEKK